MKGLYFLFTVSIFQMSGASLGQSRYGRIWVLWPSSSDSRWWQQEEWSQRDNMCSVCHHSSQLRGHSPLTRPLVTSQWSHSGVVRGKCRQESESQTIMLPRILLTLLNIFKDNYFSPRPLLHVPGVGSLRGSTVRSTVRQRDIHGYWGIPYALPPVGRRRFLPPQVSLYKVLNY